jgi:hypothetical protein
MYIISVFPTDSLRWDIFDCLCFTEISLMYPEVSQDISLCFYVWLQLQYIVIAAIPFHSWEN